MAFIFKSIQRLVINLRPPCCAWFCSHFHYPECPYSSNLSSVGFASAPALLRKPSGCFSPLQLVFLSLFIVSFLPTFCSGHIYLSHMSKTQNNYRRGTKSWIDQNLIGFLSTDELINGLIIKAVIQQLARNGFQCRQMKMNTMYTRYSL